MRRSPRTSLITGAILIVLAAGAVAAYAATNSTGATAGERAATVAPGPERALRAYDLSAATRTPLFTLANGEQVSLVANSQARCLVRNLDSHFSGEVCATAAEIVEGRATSVTDECSPKGEHLMEITGFAPAGAAEVRLLSSDGTSRSAALTSGAFKFDGENPSPGEPYPTGLEWLDGNGVRIGTAGLPVDGDQFCLPTS
jgi:hypothetical protein